MERCPYSPPPYVEFTDDHIFPQFLGGRRTIRVCKDCNSRFGHTFEGRAAKQIKRLQVFISHFGLDLTRTAGTWPAALVIGEDTYDLQSGPEGVQYVLAKPTIRKDAAGHIVSGKARSLSEANQITKGLIRAGQASGVEIFTSQDKPIDDVRLTGSFSFDDDLYRLATKMSAALLVSFDHAELVATSGIPAYLHGNARWPTAPAYCDIAPILSLRPPLAHTIYVELGTTSYAIAVFFGFLNVFVPLPTSSVSQALLASLDPLTGDEQFLRVTPVGPRSIPTSIQHDEAMAHMRHMNETLTNEAIARGAKHPPSLETKHAELGTPQDASWTNGTIRYLFPDTCK